MDLFEFDNKLNLLPSDGIVNYYGVIIGAVESKQYFDILMDSTEWKNDQVVVYGKHITTKRKIAWYGDEKYHYHYSNTSKYALAWTEPLLTLKSIVEQKAQVSFNSCLLNLYHDGDEGVSWHSDDEYTLDSTTAIASLTFGAERKFSFKHKRKAETASIVLETGSLLIMKGETQQNWLHALPKTKKIHEPRINLTFRIIKPQSYLK